MASHVRGPLYYERMGRDGTVMAFVHPNPMDQSCWLYQMAHFSTWFRCIAVDIPGYGRSPGADPGLTVADMAEAVWEAVDRSSPGEQAILMGCSVGAQIVPEMYHQSPDRTLALVLSGTGYRPDGDPAATERREMRIRNYREMGTDYRWPYTLEDFSPAFRATQLAQYFADLFSERNGSADVSSIILQFQAQRMGEAVYADIRCPTLIVTGSEDNAHRPALQLKEKIPGCELRVVPGAGHACHLEQPWMFDRYVLDFLRTYHLLSDAD